MNRHTGDHRIGTSLGKYRVVSVLGRGGMGVVYEADDTVLGRPVALKVLPEEFSQDPAAVARFLAEARAAARLMHPNVVAIFDVAEGDGCLYMAIELVRGGTAAEFIRRAGVPDWPTATRIAADAAGGLAAAHRVGLVHRDVKPANILIGTEGAVKVTDFGLVKAVDGDSHLTRAGQVMGTPFFMAPEQCRGDRTDPRTDVYGLGATYYALLTGRPPFHKGGPDAVMYSQCHEPVPDPRSARPDIPAAVVGVVFRAMAKSPDERFRDADEMLAALEGVLAAPVSAAQPVPLPPQPPAAFLPSPSAGPPPPSPDDPAATLPPGATLPTAVAARRPAEIAALPSWSVSPAESAPVAPSAVPLLTASEPSVQPFLPPPRPSPMPTAKVRRQPPNGSAVPYAVMTAGVLLGGIAVVAVGLLFVLRSDRRPADRGDPSRTTAAADGGGKGGGSTAGPGIAGTGTDDTPNPAGEPATGDPVPPPPPKPGERTAEWTAHRERAREAMVRGDWRTAVDELEAAARESADDALRGDLRTARAALVRDADTAEDRAKRAHAAGEYDRAQSAWDECLRLDPTRASALFGRSETRQFRRDYAGMLADADAGLRIDPASAIGYALRGGAHDRLGDDTRARADYDEALRRRPDFASVLAARGRLLCKAGDYRGALRDFDEAVRLAPGEATTLANRADANRHLRRYDRAVADADAAIRLDPAVPAAYAVRAEALRQSGRLEEAWAECDRLERLVPAEAIVHYTRGCIRLSQGRFAEAEEHLGRVIAALPNLTPPYTKRAEARRRLGKPDKATEDCESVLRFAPNFARAFGVKAELAADRKDWEAALELIDRAIRIDPEFAHFYRRRAEFRERLGRKAEADADRAEADRRAPDSDPE
jgi:serine/threonine protein kinase/tetratricopeptide (TPR) repeat protein